MCNRTHLQLRPRESSMQGDFRYILSKHSKVSVVYADAVRHKEKKKERGGEIMKDKE
jgi:hypothetical protein